MNLSEAIGLVVTELRAAIDKHPAWPDDQVHASAILAEEAGEVVRAAIDHEWAGGPTKDIRKEAAQAGAMAIRLLMNLPDELNLNGEE
jgi:NTP pyrophosphatase (non-canonical NTP hydrolase)